ncbi:MAG: uroporphyrinogen-III decarboxylase-like protein [Chthonomonadales bacterium]|nr:uroporphyrinogen-III decarboxylase-like protein [Chthonomonadales bacterium]
MPRDAMTPRERWLAVLTRQKPDRLPMDYWATPEASRNLMQHLGCDTMEEVYDRLHIDAVASVGPRYVGPTPPDGEDIWGVRYRQIEYETGVYSEPINHPLAAYTSVEEIAAAYTWPSPDWWDYSVIPDQVRAAGERPIRGGGSEPFLQYCVLRGLEQGMMDLIERPEIVEYCLGKLFDLAYEMTARTYEQAPGKVMITYVAEDMGSQESLLFSPAQIKRFLLPGMKRMIDLAHEAGAFVFHHSDGAIRSIIPTMIEAGIDVLNPIQWRCKGMEREGLKRDFGDQLVFHGGVDNQYTLARGSQDEVRREVEENIRILGEGGGYILAPCHNIQAVSPPENIVAMYETGYALGSG